LLRERRRTGKHERKDEAGCPSRQGVHSSETLRATRWFAGVLAALLITACATPGTNYPKEASTALDQPQQTRLGKELEALAQKHPNTSGFRILAQGRDGLRARMELAESAERTLDLQYYAIQNDVTGKLLMDAVLGAADRGARVRMLIDDAEDVGRNKQIAALAAHRNIEIRIFNPYYMHSSPLDFLRSAEWLLFTRRVNPRMHNKLFVADNAAAVMGGRNIGDEYFQVSGKEERADFDVLAIGPVVRKFSQSFDAYWNSELAIPIQAQLAGKPSPEALDRYRKELEQNRADAQSSKIASNLDRQGPLAAALAGNPLVWARAEAIYDPPQKTRADSGEQPSQLLRHRLEEALKDVKSELRVASPYLVPGEDGMKLVEGLRSRGVRVRILTNSLETTDMPIAHGGYRHYRERLLADGVELYEVRAVLGDPKAGGENLKSSRTKEFAMHAKVFVLDDRRLILGSMNFDVRSQRLNTEVGLLIDSPELTKQVSERFDAIAQPANCYIPTLGTPDASGKRPLVWKTEENGKMVELTAEPSRDLLRGIQAELLTLLPLDDML
jgi:putative cardiolipin synthase